MSENKNEAVAVGGRPRTADQVAAINRQQSGLPPQAADDRLGLRFRAQPVQGESVALPSLVVANAVVGREIQRLRALEAAIGRELSHPPIGANGMQNPYLIESQARMRADLEDVRGKIEALMNLTPEQVRQAAYSLGAR
jgi:hypothetical protein